MLNLVHRTLVGQANESQSTGIFTHPTQELLLLYCVTSQTASDAFLTYWREQFEYDQPKTTLEFHQLLDRCLSTAKRMDVTVSFVAVGVIEEKVMLAAYQGTVHLKRGQKSGQILSATDTLQLLEGKAQADDVYVLFTQGATTVHEVVGTELLKLEKTAALELIENEQVINAVQGAANEPEIGITVVVVQDQSAQGALAQPEDEAQDGGQAPTEELPQSTQLVMTPSQVEQVLAGRPQSNSPVSKLTGGLQLLGSKVATVVQAVQVEFKQLFSQDVYVRRKHRKMLGSVLIFGVVLLFTIVGTFAYFRNRDQQQRQHVSNILQPFQTRLSEIREQVGQNPVVARQRTEALLTDLEAQSQQTNQPKYLVKALTTELEQTREFYQSISGQEELPVLPTFFDLRLVQSNFLASSVDVTQDTLFFLDADQRKILALNIEKKQPTLLSIGEYPEIKAMIADEKYLYFLGQGLFRFTLSGTEVAKIVENPDEVITGGQSLGLFGSYVYVMNKPQNNIFRYTTNDDQLDSKPIAWVQTSQAVEFSTVQNFSIDGDVWLGTQQGELRKFTSGKESDFTVTGLKEAFSTPITVFTKPDLQNLYILEPQKSRLVILNKKGEFIKEVKSSTLAAATGVVANEKLGRAFALSGSLVFMIQL